MGDSESQQGSSEFQRELNRAHAEIWNCVNAFDFQCPLHWEALSPTDDERTRWCESCSQNVHMSSSPDEFITHGEAGRCVAIPKSVITWNISGMMMGRPSKEGVEKLKSDKKVSIGWWRSVVEADPDFSTDAIQSVRDRIQAEDSV